MSGLRDDRRSLTPHNTQLKADSATGNTVPLFRRHHAACWLVLIGYLLDLADGAVARQLNACSALGE